MPEPGTSTTPGQGMPLRGDTVRRYVNAFCPRCHDEHPGRPLTEVVRLTGWLVERDGRVWLERGCPEHGLVRTLYDEVPGALVLLGAAVLVVGVGLTTLAERPSDPTPADEPVGAP